MLNAGEISDAVASIQIYQCGYHASCDARNCRRLAVTVARSIDKIGRPLKQYDLCAEHTAIVIRREIDRGREVRDWRAAQQFDEVASSQIRSNEGGRMVRRRGFQSSFTFKDPSSTRRWKP